MSNVIAFRNPRHAAPDEELLIDRYRYLVGSIARRMCRVNRSLDFETLEADGLFGLLQAIRRYDPTCGVQFQTFAYTRIRGAMIDGIRRDHSDSLRRNPTAEEIEAAAAAAQRERESADSIGAVVSSQSGRRRFASVKVICIDELRDVPAAAPAFADPILFGRLQVVLSRLNETERRIIELLYFDAQPVRVCCEELGLTPWQVSRIHGAVLDKLRASLLPTDPQPHMLRVA